MAIMTLDAIESRLNRSWYAITELANEINDAIADINDLQYEMDKLQAKADEVLEMKQYRWVAYIFRDGKLHDLEVFDNQWDSICCHMSARNKA